mgnify:CR=1 FL=1
MILLRHLILTIFILSCVTSSYAQEVKDKETTEKTSKKEKKKKEKKEKKPKKEKKQKTKKEPKEKKEKEPKEESEKGVDKNFGPIFDGASISVSAGINTYFGDLADYKVFPKFGDIGKYSTSAFKFSIARDIKWGLGAKINYQKGKLEGTRKTGKNSTTKSFENSFHDLSIQPRYLISDALFKQTEYTRFKIYAHAGLGLIWYRTKLFDSNTLNTKDFEGYIETENTEGIAQKALSDKTSKATALTIPYGITVIYNLNHKVDLHFDFTQSSTSTDRLDAFNRSWTAKDKYDYIGIGITYNFNRTLDDTPKKRPKKGEIKTFDNEANLENDSTSSTINTATSIPNQNSKKGIFGNKKKSKNSNKEDELLNVRLKLFETQLKLFEMQYLLGK